MRRKPSIKKKENDFIEGAPNDQTKENKYIEEENSSNGIPSTPSQLKWPLIKFTKSPTMEEGSQLRKPINLPLKEFEWNTLDSHTKNLGVGKTEWIRFAIYKLLHEEQKFYNQKMKNES